MKNNNIAETAKNGQTANNIESKNTKKSKTPTGKITLSKETEARKKAREEQYRTFRINALKRRCKRMKLSDEDTEKLVKKLIEQMDAPKEYSILIMISQKDSAMMKEALTKANIHYKYHGDTYFAINGNQKTLATIREIAPPGAKIHPYAKKAESVIPREMYEKAKKPTNNTAEVKAKAKTARKELNKNIGAHKKGKGKIAARLKKRKTLAERKKQRKATITKLTAKNGSKSLKKAA